MRSSQRVYTILAVLVLGVLSAGCGGSGYMGNNPPPPGMGGTTMMSLFLTSSANAQLLQFNLKFGGITLNNQAEKSVTLLATPQNAEFIHLNGTLEPLVSVTIPQDTYVSATITITDDSILCATRDPTGSIHTNSASVPVPTMNNVAVNFSSPLTVTGAHMGLLLNLLVSQSLTYPSCDMLVQGPDTLAPTFTVSPITLAAQPTNSGNGLAYDLEGFVSSVTASTATFQVTAADGISWTFKTNSSTTFQGIADFSGIASGVTVNLDAAIQADESWAACQCPVPDVPDISLQEVAASPAT